VGVVGGVLLAEEEDLAGELLPDLLGEVGGAEPAVEAGDVGVGLPAVEAFETGQTVKPGDILCIIEAMKLFNEIESEISGKIVKVLVENASPVEYDQPLFLVEPTH
jgi:biotin carboxyl carrier protein